MYAISGIYSDKFISKEEKNINLIENYSYTFEIFRNNNNSVQYISRDKSCIYKINKNQLCIVIGNLKIKTKERNRAKYIFKLYKNKGINAVKKLNGSFVFLIYDQNIFYLGKSENSLIPIYYLYKNEKLYYSNSLNKILRFCNNLELNLTNIFTPILCNGIFLDDNCFYHKFYKLDAGSIIKIIKKKFELIKFIPLNFYEEKDFGLDYYVKKIIYLLEKDLISYKKKTNKIKLGLSGGIDSRIMLGILNKNKFNYETFTYGTGNFLENDIALQLSKIYNFDHKFINIPITSYIKDFASVSKKSSGTLFINMAPQFKIYKKLGNKNSLMLFGTFLDYLIGNSGFSNELYDIKNKKNLINFYKKGYLVKYKKDYFAKFFYEKKIGINIYNNIISKINSSLQTFNFDKIENLNNSFFFQNRGKRWHNHILYTASIYNDLLTPSYCNDFLNFIATIPSKYKKHDLLRIKVLDRIDNKLTTVAINRSVLPINKNLKKNTNLIKKQEIKLKKLYQSWIKNKFNKKFTSDYFYDANFSEWLLSNKEIKNFFKNILTKTNYNKLKIRKKALVNTYNNMKNEKTVNFKFIIYISSIIYFIKNSKKKLL